MEVIDARGLSCPEPVLLLRRALLNGAPECTIVVDNGAAKENCLRYGQHQGYAVTISETGGDYSLHLEKKGAEP